MFFGIMNTRKGEYMSKVRFFGLGGLGENGKNMFVVEVEKKIFILDAGLKYPSVELFGIDNVIPDFTYLIERKNQIQGLFISHGHEDHLGAVPELLKQMNINVYGTHFTISILEDLMQEEEMELTNYRLYRIDEDKVMRFGHVSVSFYNVVHSIPEAVNIVIKTKDGAIVYAPDFTFDVGNDNNYRTSFHKINEVGRLGVLALCAESLGTSNVNRLKNDSLFFHRINEVIQNSKRVIFSTFSSDLDRIQKIINISVQNNRRIAIIGRKAQKIVNIAINSGYLKIPTERLMNLKYIDDQHTNDEEDLVVIVTGTRHEPFYMLQRMCRHQDRLIKIKEGDHVVTVTPPVPGTERMAAKTIDILYKSKTQVTQINKDMLRSSHADREDLKMLYSMLRPKYIIPIIGEFRHQYMQKQVAVDAGYDLSQIIVLENGEVATFIDGLHQLEHDIVPSGDVLIDGSIVGDINEIVLKDRELLSQEGLVLITIVVDTKTRAIITEPEVVCKGLMVSESLETIIEQIKKVTIDVCMDYLHRHQSDWNKLKNDIRDLVGKHLYRNTKKNPIIMPTIINISKNDYKR